MADFSGLQDYTTPDGRTLRLPPALAASFSESLRPAQPPPSMPVDLSGSGPGTPPRSQSETLPPQMPSAPPGAVPSAGLMPPVPVNAAPMPEPPKQAAPQATPPTAPTAQAQQPPAASPRLTNRQLQTATNADVANLELGALDQEAAATEKQARAEADAFTREATLREQAAQRADQILQDRARAADEFNAAMSAKQREYERDAKTLASRKIDRSVDNPVLGLVGVLAGMVGSAMQGGRGENPALDSLIKGIDRKVDAQMQDINLQKEALAMRRQGIADFRTQGQDRLAEFDKRRMALLEQTNMDLEALKARTSSDKTLAAIDMAQARIGKERAATIGGAMGREQQKLAAEAAAKEAKRQAQVREAQGWAGISRQDRAFDEGRRQFDANLAWQKEKEAADQKLALAKVSGKNSDQYQKLSEAADQLGIRDPVTAKPLVNEQGRKLVAEADQLDKRAEKIRASKSPTAARDADLLAAKAADLRDNARVNHSIKGRTPDQAAKIQTAVSTTQQMLRLIDGVKAKVTKAGTKVLNQNELQAALETEVGLLGLEVKDLWTLGSLDEGASRKMVEITGGDSTKLTTAGFLGAIGVGAESGEKAIAKLEALANAVERKGHAALASQGLEPGAFQFARNNEAERPESKAAQALLNEKTPLQRAAGEERGIAGKAAETVLNPFGESPTEKRQRAAEERTSSKYPGLSPEQEKPMDTLLAQARQPGDAGDQARAKLIETASSSQAAPELRNAVLNALKSNEPALYQQAVQALPREQRESREGIDKLGREGESLYDVERRATAGDADAVQELFRRGGTAPGTPEGKAWARVLPLLQRRADSVRR